MDFIFYRVPSLLQSSVFFHVGCLSFSYVYLVLLSFILFLIEDNYYKDCDGFCHMLCSIDIYSFCNLSFVAAFKHIMFPFDQ